MADDDVAAAAAACVIAIESNIASQDIGSSTYASTGKGLLSTSWHVQHGGC